MIFSVKEHLLPVFQMEDLRLKLQRQLKKDFVLYSALFQEDFETQSYTLELLFHSVQNAIVRVAEMGERNLLQLLYTIDIREQDFLHLTQQKNFSEELTKLILEREATKIYFREKYK